MKKNSFLTNNLDIILILTVYTFLAIIFVSPFQHIIGGDEISYINIAHEYAMGHGETQLMDIGVLCTLG